MCKTMGLAQNRTRGRISRLCNTLNEGIVKGEHFHECLKRCGSSFPKLYTALVRIGESTGTINEIFSHLAGYLTKSKSTWAKIHSALMYPLFVLISAIAGTAALVVFIVPRMAEIFAAFSADAAINLTGNMYKSVYIVFGLLCFFTVLITICAVLKKVSKKAACYFDALLLKIPFLGSFLTALDSLDFFFAMELCGKNGMNAAESLAESTTVVRNNAYSVALKAVYNEIIKGEKISKAFSKNNIFPEYIGTWLTVGEKTGQAGTVFGTIRGYFEQNVETTTNRLLSSLEPILILLVGILVLLLLVQFVLPIFSLYGAIM
jgi:type IV pilus assembly protein PilC